MKRGSQAGFSLVELVIVITIAGILMTFAVPKTSVTVENTHVNQGVAGMRSIWLAQRRYRMEYDRFAPSLKTLVQEGFAQKQVLEQEDPFSYKVRSTSNGKLTIMAERFGDSGWKGTLTLDEMGKIGGSVRDRGGRSVAP